MLKVVQEDVYPKKLGSRKHQAAERHGSRMNQISLAGWDKRYKYILKKNPGEA